MVDALLDDPRALWDDDEPVPVRLAGLGLLVCERFEQWLDAEPAKGAGGKRKKRDKNGRKKKKDKR